MAVSDNVQDEGLVRVIGTGGRPVRAGTGGQMGRVVTRNDRSTLKGRFDVKRVERNA